MAAWIDHTGKKFGKLTAVSYANQRWFCRCECGQTANVETYNLTSGNSKACGKCRVTVSKPRTHGHTSMSDRSSTWRSWKSMKQRCNSATRDNARHYHGKGITYDPRWGAFEAFLADMGERPDGTTLDRIDNAKGYTKENCRWATATQQTRNRANAKTFTWEGQTKPIAEWAAEMNITYGAAIARIKRLGSLSL